MSKKSKKAENFIRTPGYPGGRKALNEFIKNNLKYPKEALNNRVEGKVNLRFKLNHKGKVISAKVVQGIGHGCDEEAIRIVNLLKFQAVKNRGVKATFEKSITIPFKLPKKSSKKVQSVSYEIKPSESKQKEESGSKKNTYTYTITINKNK